jgi:hypothetical protein
MDLALRVYTRDLNIAAMREIDTGRTILPRLRRPPSPHLPLSASSPQPAQNNADNPKLALNRKNVEINWDRPNLDWPTRHRARHHVTRPEVIEIDPDVHVPRRPSPDLPPNPPHAVGWRGRECRPLRTVDETPVTGGSRDLALFHRCCFNAQDQKDVNIAFANFSPDTTAGCIDGLGPCGCGVSCHPSGSAGVLLVRAG